MAVFIVKPSAGGEGHIADLVVLGQYCANGVVLFTGSPNYAHIITQDFRGDRADQRDCFPNGFNIIAPDMDASPGAQPPRLLAGLSVEHDYQILSDRQEGGSKCLPKSVSVRHQNNEAS